MNKHFAKILLLTLCMLQPDKALSKEQLVSEGIINEWGYRTVSNDKSQFIKKIKKINEKGPAVYPRFYLSKKCFEKASLAIEELARIETLQKTKVEHRDFDYRQGFTQENCLFIITTNSLMMRLDYQPKLFKLFKSHTLSEDRANTK